MKSSRRRGRKEEEIPVEDRALMWWRGATARAEAPCSACDGDRERLALRSESKKSQRIQATAMFYQPIIDSHTKEERSSRYYKLFRVPDSKCPWKWMKVFIGIPKKGTLRFKGNLATPSWKFRFWRIAHFKAAIPRIGHRRFVNITITYLNIKKWPT